MKLTMGERGVDMSIKSIKVANVMAFQRQQRGNKTAKNVNDIQGEDTQTGVFELHFSDGINVIIGENGLGKTTLLKMIYAATQWSNEKKTPGKTQHLLQLFSNNLQDNEMLKSADNENAMCYYEVSDGVHVFKDSLTHNGIFDYDNWLGLNLQSVFIPTTEMLSHSKGFLALNQKYNMPFDGTQVDIIVNASLPEAREIPQSMQCILEKISQVIDGEVVQEEDTFYVLKSDGRKIDFSLEAEGLRKLALLWKLIRNGLLEKGTTLLWDEPEANLNPELYSLVAEILLALEQQGVQIFVATHSYNFAKYLEIRRTHEEQVQFHNLYKTALEGLEIYDSHEGEIYSVSAYCMKNLPSNHIMLADKKLLDEVYEM
jgi:predicted ATPase